MSLYGGQTKGWAMVRVPTGWAEAIICPPGINVIFLWEQGLERELESVFGLFFFCFFPAENKEDDGENLRWLKVTHLPISFSPPVAESLPHTILVSRVTEYNKLTFKWPSGGCEEGGRWRGKQDEEEDDDGEDVEESGMR